VDDAKIAHVDKKVVDDIIENLESVCGKMVVSRAYEHTFVGIDFKFLNDGSVSIVMHIYINESCSLSPYIC